MTIKQRVVARNDFGEEIITWTEVGTFWGSVEPLQGRELLEARQAIAELSVRIRIRYQAGVTIGPTMRAVANDKTYLIESVINIDERDREIQLMGRELVTT